MYNSPLLASGVESLIINCVSKSGEIACALSAFNVPPSTVGSTSFNCYGDGCSESQMVVNTMNIGSIIDVNINGCGGQCASADDCITEWQITCDINSTTTDVAVWSGISCVPAADVCDCSDIQYTFVDDNTDIKCIDDNISIPSTTTTTAMTGNTGTGAGDSTTTTTTTTTSISSTTVVAATDTTLTETNSATITTTAFHEFNNTIASAGEKFIMVYLYTYWFGLIVFILVQS